MTKNSMSYGMDIFAFLTYVVLWGGCLLAWRAFFQCFGILDKPGKDVPQRDPVPTLQWISVIIAFFFLLFVSKHIFDLAYLWKEFMWLFVWWGIIAIVSIIDEMGYLIDKKYSLSAAMRFGVQLLVAAWAWWFSWIWLEILQIPGIGALELSGFTSLLATLARFVLFINAINRFDGIYGLATWMSSIGFLTIFLLLALVVFPTYDFMTFERSELLLRVQIIASVLFVISLLGTIMEYKPRWLMRDVGTMFFGFSLWYLSLLWWAKIGTMIVVLALPLFDAIRVILDRWKNKKNPLKWDYSHLHYRLLWLGWSRWEVRCFIWWWSLFFMMIMLLLQTDSIGKLIIFFVMAALFFGINAYLYRYKWYESNYTPKLPK